MKAPLTELWREVFAAADHALELDPAERQAFVERCLRENPAVGAELRALIEDADSTSFLETPASEFAEPFLQNASANDRDGEGGIGAMFGPYRVRREIGRGGMGTVYLAERADDQYRKEVALKVLPPWSGKDGRRQQRFLEERQILAALDHPAIARLLDGGVTPDGLPWFAMEYVHGQPIDAYCDGQRLSVEERLKLFCNVCSAVQYAHQNLVVHRDLKPSNILVAADGRVVLLDFGIAKLLGDHSETNAVTATADRLLTPLYASPEQIRGEPPSTATDVYALGVLLHVLLTGGYPYRLSTCEVYEVARAVLEQEPERPSLSVAREGESIVSGTPHSSARDPATARQSTPLQLARRLRGDLDAIVLKAMEKEPCRRYATAEQLETDVRRHLAGLPVIAQPASRIYYARKFLRRHRVGISVSVLTAVVAVAGATVMTAQRSRIRAQAERIALERGGVATISQYVLNLVRSLTPGDRGPEPREILDSATRLIDEHLVEYREDRANLMFELATVSYRLELYDRSRGLLEKSLALRRTLRADLEVAETLRLLGDVLRAQDSLGLAEQAYRDALVLYRQRRTPDDENAARTLVGLSTVLRSQRRLTEAEQLARDAVAIDSSRGRNGRADLAGSTSALAGIVGDQGDHRTAIALFEDALALVRETRPKDHPDVAAAVSNLAEALNRAGERTAADSLFRVALGLARRLLYRALLAGTATLPLPLTARESAAMTAPVDRALGLDQAGRSGMLGGLAANAGRIAFTSDRDGPDAIGHLGNQEIYVMNADGTDQQRLTHHKSMDFSPAWSFDGRQIAFGSQRGTGFDIFIMNADGADQRRLTHFTERGVGADEPAWSPDGRVGFRPRFRAGDQIGIWVIKLDGTGLTRLTDHPAGSGAPAWSPDGRRIAFQSPRDGDLEIYVMDPDGGNVVQLTSNSAPDGRPAWSLDGRIAFNSHRDGNPEIYVMDANGTNQVNLTRHPGEDAHPSWSPDGRYIAFNRRVLGHYQIHVMNADGTNVRRLTSLSRIVSNFKPSWGPAQR